MKVSGGLVGIVRIVERKRKAKAGDKVVELQEDRALFAQMMLALKTRHPQY